MRQAWIRVITVLIFAGVVTTAGAQARDTFPAGDRARPDDLVASQESIFPDLEQELPGEDVPSALALTAAFLELDEAQVEELIFLLQQRHQAIAPLAAQIGQLKQQLEQLLATPEPQPVAIGILVLQIRERKGAIHGLRQEFVESFEQELDDMQLQRLRRADKAKALQPVVKALDVIGLI